MRPTELGFRRPSATLAGLVLVAVGVLIALGVWQIRRGEEKAAQIALLAARSAQAPIEAPLRGEAALDFQPVQASGSFDHARELHVYGRSDRGSPGIHVVTPLKRGDGRSSGRHPKATVAASEFANGSKKFSDGGR